MLKNKISIIEVIIILIKGLRLFKSSLKPIKKVHIKKITKYMNLNKKISSFKKRIKY